METKRAREAMRARKNRMNAKKDLAKFKEFYSFALSENPEMVKRFEAYYEARRASEEMAFAERVVEDFNTSYLEYVYTQNLRRKKNCSF